jgi:5-methylcytosine-specific restriction endonuclease McrA
MTTKEKIRPAASKTDLNEVSWTDTNPTSTRICIKCSREKPLTAFAVDRSKRDGRRTVCAECRAGYDSEIDYRRRSRKHGPEPVVVPFTRTQLIKRYGNRCVYCPTGLFETTDHVLCVAAGGHHTLDNVVPCCAGCNRRKRWEIDEQRIRDFRSRRLLQVSS